MIKNNERLPIDLVAIDKEIANAKLPVIELSNLINEDITFDEFKKLQWLEFMLFGDNYDSIDDAQFHDMKYAYPHLSSQFNIFQEVAKASKYHKPKTLRFYQRFDYKRFINYMFIQKDKESMPYYLFSDLLDAL